MNRTVRLGIALVALAFTTVAGGQQAITVRPKAYGTSQDSAYRIPVTDFAPSDPSALPLDSGFPGALSRYSPSCAGFCFEAVPRLPDGALLTGIQAYFCNTDPNPQNVLGVFLYNANYDGTNVTQLPLTTFSNSHNGCGEFVVIDLSSLNYHVNYYDNQLIVRPYITDSDGSQAIAGVILYYRLQVSPAPPTSDFGDVPTSSPQFQFIEALYASGITAGCGNGDFCPNSPLTRGQMAVFLAKALGLQWP